MPARLHFVNSPKLLVHPPAEGRIACVDLAFAAREHHARSTKIFLREAGARLALFVDHHPHPAWADHAGDPRFVLVQKRDAPGCPELVTPARVQAAGAIDHLFAHADFDGLVSAVKWLAGGAPPWPEADEDARAVDAPGRGFSLSAHGRRLSDAVEQSRDVVSDGKHDAFLRRVAAAMLEGKEPAELSTELDKLVQERARRIAAARPLLEQAEGDMPGIVRLRLTRTLPPADKKFVLRELETRARIAVLEEPGRLTVATFDDALPLTEVPELHGTDGFAWGRTTMTEVRDGLVALLARAPLTPSEPAA